jgi:hypothetical protein
VLGELADNHAGGDDVHQDQDGGLWVGCARHRRDVAEVGNQGDHEGDRRDDAEDAGGVLGEAHQPGVQEDGVDGGNNDEDDGAASLLANERRSTPRSDLTPRRPKRLGRPFAPQRTPETMHTNENANTDLALVDL